MYRFLLNFMGVDTRRIIFSWVSAAEGAKWAEVVNTAVKEFRALGPYDEYKNLAPIRANWRTEHAG